MFLGHYVRDTFIHKGKVTTHLTLSVSEIFTGL